nr:MAG TPA: hypothetical protein [Caudoviricetes sp.]DAS08421.1 MAG TPA: hypothetical protein [Caudoviricetes sp.]
MKICSLSLGILQISHVRWNLWLNLNSMIYYIIILMEERKFI